MRGLRLPPRAEAFSHAASPEPGRVVQLLSNALGAKHGQRRQTEDALVLQQEFRGVVTVHQRLQDLGAVVRVGDIQGVQLGEQARQHRTLRGIVSRWPKLGIELVELGGHRGPGAGCLAGGLAELVIGQRRIQLGHGGLSLHHRLVGLRRGRERLPGQLRGRDAQRFGNRIQEGSAVAGRLLRSIRDK
jgi:hypothetical protein